MDLRKRGARREGRIRNGSINAASDPMSAIDAGSPGEVRINNDVMAAIHHLYQTSPSIRAARAILQGQLLSSGVVVRRAGQDVPLQDAFARYLEETWIPFARKVIDQFLMFGFCVVSIEEEEPQPFAKRRLLKQAAQSRAEKLAAPPPTREQRNPLGEAAEARRRSSGKRARTSRDIVAEGVQNVSDEQAIRDNTVNFVPIIPDINTYTVSWVRRGQSNYSRDYRIFSTSSRNVYREDLGAEIFFREPPDHAGNICSPIATVFQSASFISALEELALQAEVVRARQLLVTQPVPRTQGNGTLDPQNLFFDSESRAVQSAAAAEDDANAAESLTLSVKLCNLLNKMQTTDQSGRTTEGGTSRSVHVPPEVPPRLFAVPEKQQVVPNLRAPEARSDLVDLMRVVNDHIAASMGVPASVIFEGKFSSNSMSQLQLLNTTVSSMALAVNRVLTACYHECYENAKEADELILMTAPLSATSEIQALHDSGIIDFETALPAAMHSLGCSVNDIEGALKRRRDAAASAGDTALLDAQTAAKVGDADIALKTAQTAKTTAEIDAVRAGVGKTKAETKKTERDAKAPIPTPGAGGAGGAAAAGGAGGAGAGPSSAAKSR